MVGSLPACCARVASGQAAAAPPSNVTNSRRFISLPRSPRMTPYHIEREALCVTAKWRARLPTWVNNCRASSEVARPLYPQKLPRHSFAVAAVKCHKQTCAYRLAYSIILSASC